MDKPLNVRVAEALGCSPFFHDDRWYCEPDKCEGGQVVHYPGPFGSHHSGPYGALPEYDTDWSVTGPLIERYEMWVQPCAHDGRETHWVAMSNADDCDATEEGPTPLIAVCNLILALKAAGKLNVHAVAPGAFIASPPTA